MSNVAAALILDKDSRILMTLRSPKGSFPSLWELPGGKIGRGENPRETVVRDLREELGVEIEVHQWVTEICFTAVLSYHIDLYHCTIVTGTPAPLVASALKWITLDAAVDTLPLAPSAYLGYWKITDWIQRRRG